jgi:UDP-N-acetylglucosamine/UDP-N-acetylgalactosamine 4-epimerase
VTFPYFNVLSACPVKNNLALAPIPEELTQRLIDMGSQVWMVTGCAGFIGVNIVENLLAAGQVVRGVDNLSTGHLKNLDEVKARLPASLWKNFSFHKLDINDQPAILEVSKGCDYVLHQAALGSVPRSIKDPLASFEANVRGFAVVLDCARQSRVKRFVYASSSSVYGDHPDLPKIESKIGKVLSPYAATKSSNELFADVFAKTYGMQTVGLRYFNVFGPRQDPEGAYAAVIPKWIATLLKGEAPIINGDGETSRDFCFVANAVQANILAALSDKLEAPHQVFNVAFGHRTTLNELFDMLKESVRATRADVSQLKPHYAKFRDGDVRHSLADISSAGKALGYQPQYGLAEGLVVAMPWYIANN